MFATAEKTFEPFEGFPFDTVVLQFSQQAVVRDNVESLREVQHPDVDFGLLVQMLQEVVGCEVKL